MATISRRKINNNLERELATGMIVSTQVLQNIQQIWDPELIKVQFVQTVCHWCLEYYNRYETAPGQEIERIFEHYVRKGLDDDIADPLDDFLKEISDEYSRADKFNAEYLCDRIEARFREKAMENLIDDMTTHIENGDVPAAENLMVSYRRPNRHTTEGVSVFEDRDAVWSAYAETQKPLFKFPGFLGRLMNNQFKRKGLVFLMGRAKIGKTWHLMEIAVRAARARCNVAFFSIGDMDQDEMMLRLGCRITGRSPDPNYCHEVLIPVMDCAHNQDNTCDLEQRTCQVGIEGAVLPMDAPKEYVPCAECSECDFKKYEGKVWYRQRDAVEPLNKRDHMKANKKFMGRYKGKQFRLFTRANSTTNAQWIQDQLDTVEHYEGWVPDVIVLDYADLLEPLSNDINKQTRDQRNNNLKFLRKIAQERSCLIVSATQADTDGQDAFILTRKNFNEDKRILDHVTALFGLNQTDEEKASGLMRIGTILLRSGNFDTRALATVLQCLEAGRPYLSSFKYTWPKKKDKK